MIQIAGLCPIGDGKAAAGIALDLRSLARLFPTCETPAPA